MERKPLSPNLSRHTAHNASLPGAPSAAEQPLSPRRAVEQVHNEAKKEELQNHISQINSCSKPEAIKNYLRAHPETGKRFQALYDGSEVFKNYIGNKDRNCLQKITDLYGDNTDAADDAYFSVVEMLGKFSLNFRKEAINKIKDNGKRFDACYKFLISLKNSLRTKKLDDILSNLNPDQQRAICQEILPNFIGFKTGLEVIITKLKQFKIDGLQLERILVDSIAKASDPEIKNSSILSLIQDSELQKEAKSLLSFRQKELNDRIYYETCIYFKNPTITLEDKINKIQSKPEHLRDLLYATLASDASVAKDLAIHIASNIQETDTKAKTYLSIIHPTTDIKQLDWDLRELFIKELRLDPKKLATIVQYDHPFYTSGLLCKHFFDHDLTELVIEAMNAPIEGVATNCLEAVKRMKVEAAKLLLTPAGAKALSNLENKEIYAKAFSTILQYDPISSISKNLYNSAIKKNLIELVVEVMNASIEGLDDEAAQVTLQKKLAAAKALHELDNNNIDALTTIIAIEAPGTDSPYSLYKIVVEKSQAEVDVGELLDQNQAKLASTLSNGQRVCLSLEAFTLPTVLDPKWQEEFEDINFSYFTDQIRSIFKRYRESLEQEYKNIKDIDKIEDLKKSIQENEDLEKSHLAFFNADGRRVLQNALNTRNEISSTGNKMKAIVLYIKNLEEQGKLTDALQSLADLEVNMKTCNGGDQQNIDAAYMNICFSKKPGPEAEKQVWRVEKLMLKQARETILKAFHKIFFNGVMENTTVYRDGTYSVEFSPKGKGESFPEKLKARIGGNYLKGTNSFGNTHIGLALLGIVGKELGLSPKNAPPTFDPNCVSAKDFILDPKVNKLNLLTAFLEAYTFENIWEALGKELWDSFAKDSKLPLNKEEFFSDEACSQTEDLSVLNEQDPVSKGLQAFVSTIEEAKKALANDTSLNESQNEYIQLNLQKDILKLMHQKECYYKDPTFEDIDSITFYTGFSEEALARLLQELDLVTVL